jgi:hypothetical protein
VTSRSGPEVRIHPLPWSQVFDPPDRLTEVVYDRTSAEFSVDVAER